MQNEAVPKSAMPKERPGPPGGRRDRNRRARVRELCDAACQLFMERGIESTTIDDITRAAGVAKGSFYRYFDSKAALVEHLMGPLSIGFSDAFQRCQQDLVVADSKEAMIEVYQDLGARLTSMLVRHSDLIRLYLQECRGAPGGARKAVSDLAETISRRSIELTDVAHTRGILRPFPSTVSALAVVGAIEQLVFAVLTDQDVGNPLEVPQALTSLIFDGLVATPTNTASTENGRTDDEEDSA